MSAEATEASARHIWLCADDYGISTSVDVAIRDLVVRGRINATSVMVVTPSFGRCEAFALDALNSVAPHVAIGLHLTLTAPYRPRTGAFAPTRAGEFLSLAETFCRAVMHRLDPAALRSEITSQLEAFHDAFGRTPDFIDGHQHVHLFPQIAGAVLQIVSEQAPTTWVRQCGRARPPSNRFSDRKGLLLDIFSTGVRRRAAALGIRCNPAFAGTYDFGGGKDFSVLFSRFLERLPEGGLIMCHPGFVDDELERLDPLTTLRAAEYDFLAGDHFPAALAAHGVALAAPGGQRSS